MPSFREGRHGDDAVFTESQGERPENSAAIAALVQQDRASRNDAEHARRNRNKAASKRVPANAANYIGYRFSDDEFGADVIFEIKDVYYDDAEKDTAFDFERVVVDGTMSDDDAESDNEVEDGDEEGPPAPGDMQRGLFRDFLDWKGLVLIEPTALTHNPGELSEYEKQRKARIEANQDMLRQLGLA
jgi:hypothetical protein